MNERRKGRLYQSLKSLRRILGLFLSTTMLKFNEVLGNLHIRSTSIAKRSGLWRGDSKTLILLLYYPFQCWCDDGLWMTVCVAGFQHSFSSQTDDLTFSFEILWCTEEFTVDLWTSTSNMLSETCGVWDGALSFSAFLSAMHGLTFRKLCWDFHSWDDCLKCFLFINILFHCRTLDSGLLGNGLTSLSMLKFTSICFSKTIADVFPMWHYINMHLKAQDQWNTKMSVS